MLHCENLTHLQRSRPLKDFYRLLENAMGVRIAHLQLRELRFLGLIALTGLVIVLYLGAGLRLAAREGAGWRSIDLDALQRRIETGELGEREADWYHETTEEEIDIAGGIK